MKKIVRFFLSSGGTIFRLLFIGGLATGLLISFVDDLTNTKYGAKNLVIITSAFTFFPLFVALFVEFAIRGYRKEKRKKQKAIAQLQNQKG